jgi:hypothetical protein
MKGLTQQTALLMIILVTGLILTVVRLFSGTAGRERRSEISGYYQDLSLQAGMVCEDLPTDAGVILLGHAFEMEVAGNRMMKPILRRLRKEGISVVHIEALPAEDAPEFSLEMGGFPYSEFIRLSKAYPDADAILSLCGPPVNVVHPKPGTLPALLITRVTPERADDVKKLLEQEWIQAAVLREGEGAASNWMLLKGSN